MKMTPREFLILLCGSAALTGLGFFVNRQRRWNRENPPLKKATSDGVSPPTFQLPEEATRAEFRWDGLLFRTNREARTVCAYDEASGALVWESHGEDRFILPGAAFPIDLTPTGELWVANVGKKRLEQIHPKTGEFIASWEPEEPFGGCCNPVRFAVLPGGRFVTMEKGTQQASVYLPSGSRERFVTRELSPSEFHYHLYRTPQGIVLYDSKTERHWEVQ